MELIYPYLLSDLAIHFPPPEAINIRFLSIQFITMLEPTFLPAELPTSGMPDLPSEIIEAPSLNCFKSLLDNYWNNIMYNVN